MVKKTQPTEQPGCNSGPKRDTNKNVEIDLTAPFRVIFWLIKLVWSIIKFILLVVTRIGSFFHGVKVVSKAISVTSTAAAYAGGTHYFLTYLGYEPSDLAADVYRKLVTYDGGGSN